MNYLVTYRVDDFNIVNVKTFTYPEASAISDYASKQHYADISITPLNDLARCQMAGVDIVRNLFDALLNSSIIPKD